MADVFSKTSFIPQKSISPSTKRKKPSRGFFFGLSVFIFIASLILSAGVFSYKKFLEKSIENKAASLERVKEAFDPGLVDDLTRLDNRIEESKKLLESHVAITPLLDFLEEFTLKNVQFKQFDFSLSDSNNQISLSIEGLALDYATVVAQSDLLGKSRFLTNQIFSNINLDESGNVGFSLDAQIDSNLISYKNNLSNF